MEPEESSHVTTPVSKNDDSTNLPQSPTCTDIVGRLSRSASATVMTTMTNAASHIENGNTGRTATDSCAVAASRSNNPPSVPDDVSDIDVAEHNSRTSVAGIMLHTDESSAEEHQQQQQKQQLQEEASGSTVEYGTEQHPIPPLSTYYAVPPRADRIWESDRQAHECRRCGRRFSFLVRRHHCR
ncbi:hypothetical protein DFQ28_001528, partial [Apophysomyces sp. BC1034]